MPLSTNNWRSTYYEQLTVLSIKQMFFNILNKFIMSSILCIFKDKYWASTTWKPQIKSSNKLLLFQLYELKFLSSFWYFVTQNPNLWWPCIPLCNRLFLIPHDGNLPEEEFKTHCVIRWNLNVYFDFLFDMIFTEINKTAT